MNKLKSFFRGKYKLDLIKKEDWYYIIKYEDELQMHVNMCHRKDDAFDMWEAQVRLINLELR